MPVSCPPPHSFHIFVEISRVDGELSVCKGIYAKKRRPLYLNECVPYPVGLVHAAKHVSIDCLFTCEVCRAKSSLPLLISQLAFVSAGKERNLAFQN